MKRIPFCLLIILLAFLSPKAVCSQEVIDITKLSNEEDIGHAVSFFKDESRSLEIEKVNKAIFIRSESNVINLGFNNDDDWVKFKLFNPTSDSIRKIVKIGRLLIAEVELCYQINGKWHSVLGGGAIPKTSKPIRGTNIYLPFTLPPNNTTDFYLRITTHNSKALPITIINKEDIVKENSEGFTILGLIIGSIMVITLYNLFLGFSTRDSLYFHYALTNLFSLLCIMGEKGYFSYYLPDHLLYLSPIITPLTYAFWMLTSANFSVRILELKKQSRNNYFLLIGVALMNFILIVVLVILKASGTITNYQPMSVGILLFCLTAISSGIIGLKKGSDYAKYYLYAWISLLIGVILLMFTLNGVITSNLFTSNFYVIGSSCELLIFSFALADRFNVLKKDKERLKNKLVSTEGDLSVVISDNKMRHQFNSEVLVNLENIIGSDANDIRRELKMYANDIRLQTGVEGKMNFEQENIQDMDIEFKKKLVAKYPELSVAEVEIFLLMRLNLSIKEIVRIRNSSESAIKSARHRIRKKTDLSAKEIINLTLD